MKKIIAIVLIVSQLTGCATMFGDEDNKSVKVTSNTPGAKIYVDGNYYGNTSTGNTLIPLNGAGSHTITIEKPGYQPITLPVNQEVQGAYYLNIPLLFLFIIPGVIGFVVDGTTGNMYRYTQLNFNMQNN